MDKKIELHIVSTVPTVQNVKTTVPTVRALPIWNPTLNSFFRNQMSLKQLVHTYGGSPFHSFGNFKPATFEPTVFGYGKYCGGR